MSRLPLKKGSRASCSCGASNLRQEGKLDDDEGDDSLAQQPSKRRRVAKVTPLSKSNQNHSIPRASAKETQRQAVYDESSDGDDNDQQSADHGKEQRTRILSESWVRKQFGDEFAQHVKEHEGEWIPVPSCSSMTANNNQPKEHATSPSTNQANRDDSESDNVTIDHNNPSSNAVDECSGSLHDETHKSSKDVGGNEDDDDEDDDVDDVVDDDEEEDATEEPDFTKSTVGKIVNEINTLNSKLALECTNLAAKYAKSKQNNTALKNENKILADKVIALENKLRSVKDFCARFSRAI